jgi:PrtD family type I secretion system ABC transporter
MKKDQTLAAIHAQIKQVGWYLLAFSLASNLLVLVVPLYSLQVLDRVLSSYNMDTLLLLTLITLAAAIFIGLFHVVRTIACAHLGEWIVATLTPTLFHLAVRQSASGTASGGQQPMRDIHSLKNFIAGPTLQTVLDAPWAPIFLLVIMMMNIWLGLICLLGGVILVLLAYLTEVATRELVEGSAKHAAAGNQWFESTRQHAETVEAMGMAEPMMQRLQTANDQFATIQSRATLRADIIAGTSKTMRMIIQIAITGVGALLALQGHITAGAMIAASILSSRALAPFDAAIGLWTSLGGAHQAYKRLHQLLTSESKERSEMQMPAPKGLVQVENLFYRLPGASQPLLRGIHFTIEPGVSVGVIGPSAAGKSTLSKLLVGVWEPLSGTVRLDGADISQWNRQDIGSHLGYLAQHVELFYGSVRDNIARFSPHATDAAVVEAAQMAGVHEMILSFPEGYDTVYGEGTRFSPGQRQRIGLARALFGSPRFVVMDEPNSNLDGEGEMALVQAIGRMKAAGMTTVIIAHKPSIVSQMDKIVVMRAGAVEAFGDRNQIMPRYMPGYGKAEASSAPPLTLLKH